MRRLNRRGAGILGAGIGVLCFLVLIEAFVFYRVYRGEPVLGDRFSVVARGRGAESLPPLQAGIEPRVERSPGTLGQDAQATIAPEPLGQDAQATSGETPPLPGVAESPLITSSQGILGRDAQATVLEPSVPPDASLAEEAPQIADAGAPNLPLRLERELMARDGGFAAWRTPLGDYMEYTPQQLRYPVLAVAVIHCSLPDNETALQRASGYLHLGPWVQAAEQQGVLLIAPAFDEERYPNYRELEGRDVSADEFLLRILEAYSEQYPFIDRKFYLYGHSAGGQFAHRFAVTHPDRVLSLVVSAAGNYAWPADEIPWPYGRGNSPNPDGFLKAAGLPMTVIVGSEDVYPDGMGGEYQKGENRIQRGYYWIQEMARLAQATGQSAHAGFVEVPGVPHDTVGLTNACVYYMFNGPPTS